MLLTLAPRLNLLVLAPNALFDAVKDGLLLFHLGLVFEQARVV